MEEAGLSIKDLPLLTKSIRISYDSFSTNAGNHVAHSKVTHEASAVTKVLTLTLLNQDRNKVLVGIDLDAIAAAQVNLKAMLLVGGLPVRERKSRELVRQGKARQGSASHTVQLVDFLTLDFENIQANPESSTGKWTTSHVGPSFGDVQAQARLER
jgi:hypothetical protein